MNIFKRKAVGQAKRLVWRMSPTHPAGAFVDPSDRETNTAAPPAEPSERGFRASSMDLTGGSEVTETEIDTLPGELADVFRKGRR